MKKLLLLLLPLFLLACSVAPSRTVTPSIIPPTSRTTKLAGTPPATARPDLARPSEPTVTPSSAPEPSLRSPSPTARPAEAAPTPSPTAPPPTRCSWQAETGEGEVDPETFVPCGAVQEEASFNDYTVRVYKRDLDDYCSSTALDVLRGGERIYAYIGLCRLQIGHLWVDNGTVDQSETIPMGQDVTGDGQPDLIIFEWAGGAYCCASHHVYEIGDEFKYIDTIDSGEYPMQVADLDQDGALEFTVDDWSFRNYREWPRVAGSYCNPSVVLDYQNGSYDIAPELMLRPAPTTKELQARALEFRGRTEEGLNEAAFWGAALELIYSGHAGLVEQFLAMVFPDDPAQQARCVEMLQEALPESPYWQQIREMNAEWPWPEK